MTDHIDDHHDCVLADEVFGIERKVSTGSRL